MSYSPHRIPFSEKNTVVEINARAERLIMLIINVKDRWRSVKCHDKYCQNVNIKCAYIPVMMMDDTVSVDIPS